MMEIFSSYPVRKIVIEFKDGDIYANGRKYKDVHEVIEWLKDVDKTHNNPFNSTIPK